MNIETGWYIPTTEVPTTEAGQRPRWVLAVSDTHVLYGSGGGAHRECRRKTFARWAARVKAERKTQA